MKMVMPWQFTLNWPFRINKIASTIVCLVIGVAF